MACVVKALVLVILILLTRKAHAADIPSFDEVKSHWISYRRHSARPPRRADPRIACGRARPAAGMDATGRNIAGSDWRPSSARRTNASTSTVVWTGSRCRTPHWIRCCSHRRAAPRRSRCRLLRIWTPRCVRPGKSVPCRRNGTRSPPRGSWRNPGARARSSRLTSTSRLSAANCRAWVRPPGPCSARTRAASTNRSRCCSPCCCVDRMPNRKGWRKGPACSLEI